MKVYYGFPQDVVQRANGETFLVNDNSFANKSQPFIYTGNGEEVVIESDNDIYLKGIVIVGQGNQGKVYVKDHEGTVVLPAYFSNTPRIGTGSALNINCGKSISIERVGRGSSDESFVGLSWIEVET